MPERLFEDAEGTPSLKRSKTMKEGELQNVASHEESQQPMDAHDVAEGSDGEDGRKPNGDRAAGIAKATAPKAKGKQPKQKAKAKAKKAKPVKMSMSQGVEEVKKEPSKLPQHVRVLRDKKKELADLKKKQAM